jgi:hypothetical protein
MVWLENTNPAQPSEYSDALRHTHNRVYCNDHPNKIIILLCERRSATIGV